MFFFAEMPRFEGDENPNVFPVAGEPPFTEAYKKKCQELVRMHNKHKCAVAVNGCKRKSTDRCNRGYSNTDEIQRHLSIPLLIELCTNVG